MSLNPSKTLYKHYLLVNRAKFLCGGSRENRLPFFHAIQPMDIGLPILSADGPRAPMFSPCTWRRPPGAVIKGLFYAALTTAIVLKSVSKKTPFRRGVWRITSPKAVVRLLHCDSTAVPRCTRIRGPMQLLSLGFQHLIQYLFHAATEQFFDLSLDPPSFHCTIFGTWLAVSFQNGVSQLHSAGDPQTMSLFICAIYFTLPSIQFAPI